MAQHAKLNDPELEAHYQALFSLYATPGWRALMADVANMLAAHDTVSGVETVEQLWERKGELRQMQWLANHQPATEYAYNHMLAEQEGTLEEAPTGGVAKVLG